MLAFYSNLFAGINSIIDNELVEKVIPNLVSSEDNALLTNFPSLEEV